MNGTRSAARSAAKVGRNDPCPCGSGKKYKQCCQPKETLPSALPEPSRPPKTRRQELASRSKLLADSGRWAEAIPQFRELARLDPQSAEAHRDLGAAYLRCSRYAEAAASLKRALDIRPSFEIALRDLLVALEPLARESEALATCRKLARIVKDPIERRFFAVRMLMKENRVEEAERDLRQALALAPGHAGMRLLLGQLLGSKGAFEEAADHLAAAAESIPSAYNLLTTAKRMTEADRPLVDRMRLVLEAGDLNPRVRSAMHFSLGKALDDLGEYAQAIQHYDEGNRIRAALGRLDRAKLAEQYGAIVAASSAEVLAATASALADIAREAPGLPVFILGMPRSGTTLVEQILSAHPAVAAGGELSYWSNVGRAAWGAKDPYETAPLRQAADDYRSLLRGIGPDALRVTDKLPQNFEQLGLIRAALPDARIVHCRRNAIDTCLSAYFQNFWESVEFSWDKGDLVFFYRQYERLMEHWRSVLPRDRFTEVDYEALVENREAETRRLIAFLGLDWHDACLEPERNKRMVTTASVWQTRQPIYRTSVGRWRRYEPWLGELWELLPEGEDGAAVQQAAGLG